MILSDGKALLLLIIRQESRVIVFEDLVGSMGH